MRPSATLTASMALLLIQSVTADFLIMETYQNDQARSLKQPQQIGIVPSNQTGCDKQSTFTQNRGWKDAGSIIHKTIKNTNCPEDSELNFERAQHIDKTWFLKSYGAEIGVCEPPLEDKKGHCDTASGEWAYKALYHCYAGKICDLSKSEKRWVA